MSRQAAGFTLIEVLVVMLILGLLAVTVNLTLPDPARRDQADALAAWRRQAELGGRLSEARATAMAWEIHGRQAHLLERREAGWLPLRGAGNSAESVPELPAGLRIGHLEIEGLGGDAESPEGQRVIFEPGQPPLFRLQIAGQGRSWRIEGLPSGRVELHEESSN